MATKRTQADGNNVEIKREGTKLILTIDTSKFSHFSKSGKSQVVASTGGNVLVEGNLKCGLNVFDMSIKDPDHVAGVTEE